MLGARRLEPERAQDRARSSLQQPDQRPEDEEEPAHGRRERERGALGVAERDPLRHELADHDVEVRDDQQREDHREERSPSRRRDGARAPARRGRRSPSEEIVTPSCIAEMNRGGLPVIRSTARARRLPSCSSSRIRVRREVTRPYSAATKNAFSRTRPEQGQHLAGRRSRVGALRARAYWAADRRPRESVQRSIAAAWTDANICSIIVGCGSSTARSRARSALNRVKGMPFDWSLNPYMGCVHRCTFCYVRAFEQRADRPVRRPLRHVDPGEVEHRRGAAARAAARRLVARRRRRDRRRDRSVPAGRGPLPADPRLHRGARATPRSPFSIITRGPLIVRDVDVLAEASRRADVSVTFSVPTLDDDVWRHDRARHRAAAPAAARARASSSRPACARRSAWRRSSPASPTDPSSSPRVVRAAREAGACGVWANVLYLRPGHARALPRVPRRATGPSSCPSTSGSTRGRAYLPQSEAQPARDEVRRLARAHGIRDRQAGAAAAAGARRTAFARFDTA